MWLSLRNLFFTPSLSFSYSLSQSLSQSLSHYLSRSLFHFLSHFSHPHTVTLLLTLCSVRGSYKGSASPRCAPHVCTLCVERSTHPTSSSTSVRLYGWENIMENFNYLYQMTSVRLYGWDIYWKTSIICIKWIGLCHSVELKYGKYESGGASFITAITTWKMNEEYVIII